MNDTTRYVSPAMASWGSAAEADWQLHNCTSNEENDVAGIPIAILDLFAAFISDLGTATNSPAGSLSEVPYATPACALCSLNPPTGLGPTARKDAHEPCPVR